MNLVAGYAFCTGVMSVFGSYLWLPIGDWGIGNRLMVGYHKSAIADTPAASDRRTQMIWNFIAWAYQSIAMSRVGAADDLWYPTMRKLPQPSTSQRIQTSHTKI
jgi:hypothetical protein